MRKFDLQKRLIQFTVLTIELSSDLKSTYIANHLSHQLLRSTSSTALNYGEAQAAESRKDFIHKMRIILKELRESYICIEIIRESKLCRNITKLEKLYQENNELISIFVKSIETAQRKLTQK